MDQYLLIPFLGEWTSINPSYFDVNRRATIGFDCHISTINHDVTLELYTNLAGTANPGAPNVGFPGFPGTTRAAEIWKAAHVALYLSDVMPSQTQLNNIAFLACFETMEMLSKETMVDFMGVTLWLCQNGYWTWPIEIVFFFFFNVIFHSYVSLPEGIWMLLECQLIW